MSVIGFIALLNDSPSLLPHDHVTTEGGAEVFSFKCLLLFPCGGISCSGEIITLVQSIVIIKLDSLFIVVFSSTSRLFNGNDYKHEPEDFFCCEKITKICFPGKYESLVVNACFDKFP